MGITVVCEGCGAVCNTDDGYCKSCWKKLPGQSEDNDGTLEGFGISEWKDFVEKNTDYYIPIFKQNEGKRFFLSMNWAAFVFRNDWLFYRKMYKASIVSFLLIYVALLVFALLYSIPCYAEVQQLQEPIKAYEAYLDEGGEKHLTAADGSTYRPEVVKEGQSAKYRLSSIQSGILFKSVITLLIVQPLVFGLFGNAIYKSHIKKRIYDPNAGGASIANLLLGWLIFDVLETVLANLSIGLILAIGS